MGKIFDSVRIYGTGTTTSTTLQTFNGVGTNTFVVRDDGNVGIGTPTPTTKLEISGDTKLSSLSNVFKISSYTALGMSQGVGAANVFIGGGVVTDALNGGGISIGPSSTSFGDGVSIGQTAKADSSAGDSIAIGRNSTANGTVRSVAIGRNATSSASNAWALGYNATANQDNTFIFGDSSDINIKSGFGTNTPEARIHIKGIDSSSSNYGLKVQNSGGTNTLQVRNDGLLQINTPTLSYGNLITVKAKDALNDSLVYRDSTDSYDIFKIKGDGYTTARALNIDAPLYPLINFINQYSTWTIERGGYNLSINEGTTERLFMASGGNVGFSLGATPEARIHIKGSDSSTSNYGLKVQNSGGTDNLVVRNDGNVGIGTSNPTQKLHILSYATGGVLAQLNDSMFDVGLSGSVGQLRFSYGSNIEFMMNPYPTAFNTSFRFKSNPAGTSGECGIEHSVIGQINGVGGLVIGEALNIGSSGLNAGVVWGKVIRKSGFLNTNAVFYPLLVMDGNVGIGTTTPSEKLEVNGKTKTTTLQVTSNPVDGYVLTSDVSGNATWQQPQDSTSLGTGLTIHFSGKTIFNLPSSPVSGNISGNTTNAKFGMIQKIYHQSAVEPTFPATWKLVGEGVYFTNELNIIYAEYVEPTWIEYWIIQQQ